MSHLGSVLELSDLPEKPTIMEISQIFYQTTSWLAPELITNHLHQQYFAQCQGNTFQCRWWLKTWPKIE